MSRTRIVRGVSVPTFFYGTAWKEDATESLVEEAIGAGFRGIDTANQRKHYYEAAVGRAVSAAISHKRVRREDLFLQTKFTFARGQDHRLPYDPAAPIAEQVEQSFASSLEHLAVKSIDSLVLHGPTHGRGIAAADREAWSAMEAIHARGGTRLLGVSNVSAEQLEAFIALAREPPAFVQNRCYARDGWDEEVRAVCKRHGVVYQGFSLLTANRNVVASPAVAAIASRHRCTPAAVIFRFAFDLGMLPLTGTTQRRHMELDLAAEEIALGEEERASIARLT